MYSRIYNVKPCFNLWCLILQVMERKHNQNTASLSFKSIAGKQNGSLILFFKNVIKLLCHARLLREGNATSVFNYNF